jgi:hypothetical protein
MTDEVLMKHCMCGCMYLEAECPNCNKVTDADRIEALNAEREACAVLVSDLLDGYGTDQIDFATFEAVSAAAEAFVARARKGV